MKPTLIYDIEIFRNYFLVMFLDADTHAVTYFEAYPEEIYDDEGMLPEPIPAKTLDIPALRKTVRESRTVSFNGLNFDLPILTEAMRGASVATLKKIADRIIKNNMKYWQLGIELVECDHVDIFSVAPGMASLKIYGGRLHCQRMQDLPIEPDAEVTPEDRARLREYCVNDLYTTLSLFRKVEPQVLLREQMGAMYGLDLRSKSDAQIAEAVIRKEVEKSLGRRLEKPEVTPGDSFLYTPPTWVKFKTLPLQETLQTVRAARFVIGPNGAVQMPAEIASLKIGIGEGVYRMGIGGLHSSEKSIAHFSDEANVLIDRDVTSYYPSIILNCGLRPRHMGAAFTQVYRSLVERRLAAKRAGNTVEADALKITINGSFGKFGSQYSILYSPTLLIQTTVTGQLALLMLIEDLESEGIPVVSANTDGIVIKCPRSKIGIMHLVIDEWEMATAFGTEETRYRAIYSRDVNNYIALKEGKGYKLKGAYAPAGLSKNPTNEVCVDAVVRFLTDGSGIEDTIRACRDIRKFVTIRNVKGGAVKGDVYLGKAVRWYYALGETGTINYKVNGFKVAGTDAARPLMEIPETFPEDVDHDWYIREATSILNDIGGSDVSDLV